MSAVVLLCYFAITFYIVVNDAKHSHNVLDDATLYENAFKKVHLGNGDGNVQKVVSNNSRRAGNDKDSDVHTSNADTNTNADTRADKDAVGVDSQKQQREEKVSRNRIAPCDQNSNKCRLSSIGQDGKWEQDWDFAETYGQFPLPRLIKAGQMDRARHEKFQPSHDAPYPWPTSWKWIDKQPHCKMQIMLPEVLCQLLEDFDIDRIGFYGDSLTQQHYESFVNKLGSQYVQLSADNKFNSTLLCNSTYHQGQGQRLIQLFHKRDAGGQASPPRGNRTEYKIDEEMTSFLTKSTKPVLGIFNIGLHYHKFQWYKEDTEIMLYSLNRINRTQDMYFFRTTAPGHPLCSPRDARTFNWTKGTRDIPLSSLKDLDLTKQKFHWDSFEDYNRYTLESIREYSLNGTLANMHFLDIYNMTALRQDGHGAHRGDCLHYVLPGPLDWWNHFLVTYLHELRKGLKCKAVI